MTRAALLEELEELKRTGRAAARAVVGARRAMRANILAICERWRAYEVMCVAE
jgi:hypothetical protein